MPAETKAKGHADPCAFCAKPIRQNQYAWTFKLDDGTTIYPLHRGCGPKWWRANRAFKKVGVP